MIPSDLRFTKEHEWVRVKGDRVMVGITEYAQNELGDVVFVDLPAVGEKFQAEATLATVESVKAVSEIYAPISGEVMEVNDDLQHSPEYINQDPYHKGWIVTLEPVSPAEIDELLSAEEYQKLIGA